MAIAALSGWTSEQKHVVAASFLGWSLDAFDFFPLVFVLKDIAVEFHSDISNVTLAILLTLAMRSIGAIRACRRSLGPASDVDGRYPVVFNSRVCLGVRAELDRADHSSRALWRRDGRRVASRASLTMETIPPHARGFVSGLLQSGYPTGYFIASIVYGGLFPYIGWRGMFMVGVIPALLVLYIRRNVPESPSWSKEASRK
jgi:SHS family lactate transporter-like MFS transporter